MSPLQIKIMLHYHCIPLEWEGVESFVEELADMGMLKRNNPGDDLPTMFSLSRKGTAFVDKICSIPIPTETTVYTFGEEE